jgi:hypothetical protein
MMYAIVLLLSVLPPVFGQEAEPEEAPQEATEAPADEPVPQSETDAPVESPPADETAEDLQAEVDAFLGAEPPVASPPVAAAPNALNPRITAFGDVFYSASMHDGEVNPMSTFWLRSLEFDVRADVDPFAKAVAVLAFEQDDPVGEHDAHEDEESPEDEEDHEGDAHASAYHVVPEEVYIDLVALPAQLSARVGQQLLPFGVTNRMHPHDWPWPDMPLPFATLVGDHGVGDVGAVVSYRVHNPWDRALTVQAGAVSGALFDPEQTDPAMGWLGRVEYFDELGALELGVGVSAMGLRAEHLEGADLLLRWRQDSWRSVVLIGELIREGASDGTDAGDLGWVGTLQVQPTRPLYFGLRADGMAEALRYGGTVSYYTSEFLRLRAAVFSDGDEWRMDGQLTFVWGSHPVEPYWVNR